MNKRYKREKDPSDPANYRQKWKLAYHFEDILKNKYRSNFKKIGFTSLNQNYQDPLALAKLIIANIGMVNLREMKTKFIIPFFVKMPDMYEKFLEKLFLVKQWYPLVTKRQNPSHPWLRDGKQEKAMKPDLVTYKGGLQDENIVSVIDAKYMEKIKEGERYQIAFYLNEYHKKIYLVLSPHLNKNEKIWLRSFFN